jgi:hypothetical protein
MLISQTTQNEPWVKMMWTKPAHEQTAEERAECELAETAINRVMERLHEKTSIGVFEIEMYPCGDQCQECEAEAA